MRAGPRKEWTGFEPWSGSLRRVVEEEEANERSRSRRRMKRMPLKSFMMLGVPQSLSNNSSKGGGVGVEIFLVALCHGNCRQAPELEADLSLFTT